MITMNTFDAAVVTYPILVAISTEQAAPSDKHDSPKISVSSEDFWKTFGPLLKHSVNG